MKRVLITGANSYIGMSFEQYAKEHYSKELEIDTLDMQKENWKKKDFRTYDAIFHVAGIAHADIEHVTEETKKLYYRVNTELAINTAKKAREEKVGQFVFMSSMIIYGGMEHISDSTEPEPANFYGDSKWKADKGIQALENNSFKVAIIRPPMIYGKGSKGNYKTMESMAKRLPVFPKVKNKRSMLYIENLCELLCNIFIYGECGIFFPQNGQLVNTSNMVKMIADAEKHKICVTSMLVPFVALGKHMPGKIGKMCKKAFGSSYYDLEMSQCKYNYQIVSLNESIEKMCNQEEQNG